MLNNVKKSYGVKKCYKTLSRNAFVLNGLSCYAFTP